MSKDTDIIASSQNISTICPELNEAQRLYLYRELRDLLPKKTLVNSEAELYEPKGAAQDGYNIALSQVNDALAVFFGIEGNAV